MFDFQLMVGLVYITQVYKTVLAHDYNGHYVINIYRFSK
jgi:hypothetical protein